METRKTNSAIELLKNMKILYVEDNSEAREELTDVLKRRAGKVLTAENGKQGVELYEDHLPDIVLADLYMPEMGGIEMIRQIRRLSGSPAVIVISAANEVDTILGAVDAGIDKYLRKPVSLKALLEALSELAELLQSQRPGGIAIPPENKKVAEAEIKKEFAAFLKASTGKGPRDVSVFIQDNHIEIMAAEVLTVLEKSLLDDSRSSTAIRQIRELFFSVKETQLCEMLFSILRYDVRLKEILINPEKDRNKLIFTILREN
ncbi:MAG: response regulator [Firmicutes bacterium]|nr:response regulator [Bacillota bacterium]